jgi:hypothetical protein
MEGVQLEGRTGPKRGAPYISSFSYVPELKSYVIRVDDPNNLEFWLQMVIPEKEFIKAESKE